MSLIKNIKVGLQLDAGSFLSDASKATRALDELASAASRTQSAVKGIRVDVASGPAGAGPAAAPAAAAAPDFGGTVAAMKIVGSEMSTMAGQIQSSLAAGFAPMTQIGSQIANLVNQIGGVIDDLRRKVEGAMKMQTIMARLQGLQQRIASGFAAASAKAAGSLNLVDRAILKLGPSAERAVAAMTGFMKVKGFLASLHTHVNAAVKPLTTIAKITFASPASSAQQLSAALPTISSGAKAATSSFRGLAVQMAAAFGVVGLAYKAAMAIRSFVGGGVSGAISLAETENKVTQAFGESGAKVTQYAKDMAKAFGIPKGEALDAASSIGLMATGAGQTKEAAAGLAVQMTQLAADTASLYHIPLDQALGKIQSALAGESKPLRELGVNMSEDAVKAEGMRLGFIKAGQELNEAGKIAARSSVIMKGLSAASGDLERTQDSTANQLMLLKGRLANVATEIGTMLLPVVNKAVGMFSEFLVAASATFESSKAAIQPFIDATVAGFDRIRDVFVNFPTYAKIAWLQVEAAAINGLSWVETIPANLQIVGNYVANNWRALMVDSVNAVGNVFKNLGENIGNLFSALHDWATGKGFNFEWKGLLDGFKATADKLPEFVKPQLVSMDAEIGELFKEIDKKKGATAAKPPAPPKVEAPQLAGGAAEDASKKEKSKEATSAGALELGSREAVSAVAQFRNQSGGDTPKAQLAEAKTQTKALNKMQQALMELAHRGGESKLSAYTF